MAPLRKALALFKFSLVIAASSSVLSFATFPATAQSEQSNQLEQGSSQPGPHVNPGYYRQVNDQLGALLSIYDAPADTASVIVQLPGDTILNSSGEQKQTGETLWQMVSLGEIEGWVHASQLKEATPLPFTGTDLPVLGVCGGTEPSWSIEWNSNTVTYSNTVGLLHRVPFHSVKAEPQKKATLLKAGNDTIELQMTITEKQCTSTALDSFVWGEAVATITEPNKPPLTLMGCCRPVSDAYE